MIIYPAIDLRSGKVVRLKQGDSNRQTVFSDDPLGTAQAWLDQGASWIHMVNLDGAFAAANDNESILEQVAHLNLRVQFGGGLRQTEDIVQAFERGASRVVLGTIAVQQPEIVKDALQRWGADAICIALDARDGKIATHGWRQVSDWTPEAFGNYMAAQGIRHALYTDVTRDGELTGANVEATVGLARATGLQVIASGGINSLDDIRGLAQSQTIAGAVIGTALYESRFTLRDALLVAGDTYAC